MTFWLGIKFLGYISQNFVDIVSLSSNTEYLCRCPYVLKFTKHHYEYDLVLSFCKFLETRKIPSLFQKNFFYYKYFSSSLVVLFFWNFTYMCLFPLPVSHIYLFSPYSFLYLLFLTISFLWFHKSPVLLPLVIYWGIFLRIVTTASMVVFILFLFLSSVSSWILPDYFLSFSLVIYSLNLCYLFFGLFILFTISLNLQTSTN